MYKRKKRRTNKGKKKLSTTTTTASPSPTPSGAVWTDEPKVAGATGTTSINNIMSVTTMEVAENHHHHQQQQQPPSQQPPRQPVELTTTSNSKAVGARKRKPMQISKIVDKLPMMNDHHHALDFGAEKNLVHNNNNNNNSPPYKKPCLETSKNGMIKNILSELKTAKMGGGGNSRGESLVSSSRDRDRHRRRYEREGGDEDDDDDDNDKSDEDEGGLCIKDDGDDEGEEYEDDDDEEGVDYTGSGNEEANYLNNKKQNVYVNTASAVSSVPTTALKDRSGAGVGISSSLMRAHHYHHPLHSESLSRDRDSSDLAEIKNILSNTGIPGELRSSSSPNGWDRKYLDEDDSANDEGADLRSVTGNSTGDDELPFRCGVCAYGSCDKSTLLRHMRTHSGERPFQCRLCYFAFTTKANCERHLRNRHGQIDRDQLRNLVVCLPTSSNASESETEVNSNSNCGGGGGVVGLGHQPSPVASVEAKVKRTSGSGGGTIVSGEESSELPLDLSMDAVDLSTKSRDGNPIFRRKASLPRPRPMYVGSEMNSLVTSPFNPKREPLVHPSLPISTFSPHAIAQPAPIVGAHPSHPAFLFPFGGPPGFNPFVIPQANVEKLIGLGSSSPPKIPNPFISASPRASYENRDTLLTTEKDVKLKSEPISESKKSVSNSKSTSSSSASPTTSSSNRKRGENGNGEYQKPKQRRYRTERPFACPHCPARFTLRSNMERHGKHQHPTVWQRSPSNRVINRQKNQQLSPLVGPPTLVHPNTYTSNPGSDTKEKNRDSAVNVNVRAVIAQQLKRKLSNSSLRNNNNGSETETDPENTPAHDSSKTLGGDNSDLASVSQLLDRVKSSNFAQYFNEAENRIVGNNNDQNNSDDDGEGDESGEEEGMSSEEGDSKTSGGEKKKSAYSSAPHKISCPHCTRRFPWTSSLRRHLLTHTGQKPFQCSKCPLLFTTKSNCDRHLARKHSGANSKGASDSNNSSEDEEGEACEEEKEEEPETGDEEAGGETYGNGNNTCSSSNQSSLVKTPPVNNGSTSSSPGEDAAFRCHLCEAAAGERDALLAHMEENHKDTFHLLVSKGALSSSPPSENSETEQVPLDQRDVTHRKVMCVFCIRRFWSVEDLRRHIRSHSGERPFSCPHCSRRFTLKHSMLRHLKKHSNSVTPSRKITKTPKDLSIVSTTLSTGNSLVSASSGSHHKNGDLIGRLLGLNDDQLVEKLLSQPDAKDAAKLLGLGQQQQLQQSSSRVTSKVT